MPDEPLPAPAKPGLLTTEFYMTVGPMVTCCVLAIIAFARGDLDAAKWFLGIAMGGGSAYGAVRSFAKRA
jgi:hypothetical protein